MKKLYWVKTLDGDENWFIIANNVEFAKKFHEEYEGYSEGDATACLMNEAEKEYQSDEVYHAQLDMLEDMGFEIISKEPARVVRKNGVVYREGIVPHTIMFCRSEEEGVGVYILKVSGTDKYKIGIANNFRVRFRNLQTGSSEELEPVIFCPTQNSQEIEKYLHDKYVNKRLSREWFRFSSEEIESVQQDAISLARTDLDILR